MISSSLPLHLTSRPVKESAKALFFRVYIIAPLSNLIKRFISDHFMYEFFKIVFLEIPVDEI